jgi:hypothetical protein
MSTKIVRTEVDDLVWVPAFAEMSGFLRGG